MKIIYGTTVFKGFAIGKIFYFSQKVTPSNKIFTGIKSEKDKFEAAKEKSILQLEMIKTKQATKLQSTEFSILEAQQFMLTDKDFGDSVLALIEDEKITASQAVERAARKLKELFLQIDDEYMRARSFDIDDISGRLLKNLDPGKSFFKDFSEPVIILAGEMTTSELLQIDSRNILALAVQKDSLHSHLSIIAKSLAFPTIINFTDLVDGLEQYNGKHAILDANDSKLMINPNTATQEKYEKIARQNKGNTPKISSETLDQSKILLAANVGSRKEIVLAKEQGVNSIGLFRTEFLFLNEMNFLDEEKQFEIYKEAALLFSEKNIKIRTIDIGSDKAIESLEVKKEKNPAMGNRGIRFCMQNISIFETQLRAILRASNFGNISIMFPMIISVEEVLFGKSVIKRLMADLENENPPFNEQIKIGAMIETPAAALISADLAKELDFFSIGSNDLTQFTLAVDRQNGDLEQVFNDKHPAVLQLIELTAKNAKNENIPVSICGDIAGDFSLFDFFESIGISELSLPVSEIVDFRTKLNTPKNADVK